MIHTMHDLIAVLKLEKGLYMDNNELRHWIAHTKNFQIYRYQKYLRFEEYFYNKKTLLSYLFYGWYKRRKNIAGQRLGFDIPINCIDEGLVIHHVGMVVVNRDAKIGKNCCVNGNVCIGGKTDSAPIIGDNCEIGYGAIIIGNVVIAKNVTIGAGAVITKSCINSGAKLAGVPAKQIGIS